MLSSNDHMRLVGGRRMVSGFLNTTLILLLNYRASVASLLALAAGPFLPVLRIRDYSAQAVAHNHDEWLPISGAAKDLVSLISALHEKKEMVA